MPFGHVYFATAVCEEVNADASPSYKTLLNGLHKEDSRYGRTWVARKTFCAVRLGARALTHT